ncbi:MAG: diguanylate cyclase [Candidatus Omnitrophica bacterium]|nr:diguanylate cyclase [Candidatus Omnitrophota bacterium]
MAEVNIIIIEDSPEAASLLESTLRGVGYKAWVVSEPKEGLKLLGSMACAAVITELRSAKMNGVEVARAVHKISPETNVIVITFYSFINSAVEAMEAGAYAYIIKPLNISEIRLVTEHAVERFYLSSSNKEKEHYAQLAAVDGLTGLYNRRYFKELMQHEVAKLQRYASNLSLLMIDIDDFKIYNDTYGHPAGDDLLRKLSKLLRAAMREMDYVCRYGGEEFVVVLPQTDKKGAEIVAERLRAQAGLYLPTTLSIGVATYPEDGQQIDVLIEKADAAMYKAKKGGKNKYCLA